MRDFSVPGPTSEQRPLVELLGTTTFFDRPVGQAGYALVVFQLLGSPDSRMSGTRLACVLRQGDELDRSFFDRVKQYRVYRVDLAERDLSVSHRVRPYNWETNVTANLWVEYRVRDPQDVALQSLSQDPLERLRKRIAARLEMAIGPVHHDDVTPDLVASAATKVGSVGGLEILDAAGTIDPDPDVIAGIILAKRAAAMGLHPYLLEHPELVGRLMSDASAVKLEQMRLAAGITERGMRALPKIIDAWLANGGDPARVPSVDELAASLARRALPMGEGGMIGAGGLLMPPPRSPEGRAGSGLRLPGPRGGERGSSGGGLILRRCSD